MKDITQPIRRAINQNVLWSVDLFFGCMEMLRESGVEISYWENEENWATIVLNNEPIGYLWKKYPVLFIVSDFCNYISSVKRKFHYLSIITVDDLSYEILNIDMKNMHEYFDCAISYCKFSATDLWFETNSI